MPPLSLQPSTSSLEISGVAVEAIAGACGGPTQPSPVTQQPTFDIPIAQTPGTSAHPWHNGADAGAGGSLRASQRGQRLLLSGAQAQCRRSTEQAPLQVIQSNPPAQVGQVEQAAQGCV